MQVTDISAGKRYIGNIANPQLIGRGWDKALYQVLPLMVTMVGIGCALAAREEASGGVDEAACRSCRDRA